MAVLSPPTPSPLLLNTKANFGSPSSPSPLPLITFSSTPTNYPSSLLISSYTKSGNGLASEDKKILLERYGYDADADEYFSQSSPKVLGGTARRKKLLSPKGMDVRPMMEVVKGATFDILQAAGGSPASLRPGRWLDLYSGTGSVGIEALSRGCCEVHFVEMDPWVVSDVLRPNLEGTGFLDASVIHTVTVEKFFERGKQFVGNYGPFDYISVTPPYTQVDYGVLMRQISESSLVGEDAFIVVEYPSKTDMLDSCGHLVKITDRRFGRTLLAIYGPTWAQKKRRSHFQVTQLQ
ncbi:uncharacterized protein LOC130739307 isoform X2 [Lotus japonicus]|uniref:uncharacterized protein LOC130739307 isoform X2 n=1 Tax=Lotus japonicus TaxID=34305 RepID=UPI00258798E9|nr:uncharacterized protein LOC130739307 isoform X2 [Lotus japonicus]